MDKSAWLGIGAVRGRFGRELVLRTVYGRRDPMNMLLEILTGLPFSKVEVDCAREYIPSVIRLVEAYDKTIVKLSLNICFGGKYHRFSSSG